MNTNLSSRSVVKNTIVVAALGYFVDIYDLIIFSIVRKASLTSMGLGEKEVLDKGLLIINMQMLGMLIGGILWGILGDKRGRLKVLFGSIILYSVANIANAYVGSVEGYVVWRFVAGIGLAGELGAGITLVAETMPKKYRGYGTSVVAGFGILGAVLAYFVAQSFSWRDSYLIGGVLGFSLLLLRIGVMESTLFENIVHEKGLRRGSFLKLFVHKKFLVKYMQSIGIGIPIWFVVGILITFAGEFAKHLGVRGEVLSSKAVLFCYLGLAFGDFVSGLISQWLESRKRALLVFYVLLLVALVLYFTAYSVEANYFYFICFFLGFASGYWAIFVTIGAEQFGTNLRSTVTTTIPNFVRGALPLISLFFTSLQLRLSYLNSAVVTAVVCMLVAFLSVRDLKETFHEDLDYHEDL